MTEGDIFGRRVLGNSVSEQHLAAKLRPMRRELCFPPSENSDLAVFLHYPCRIAGYCQTSSDLVYLVIWIASIHCAACFLDAFHRLKKVKEEGCSEGQAVPSPRGKQTPHQNVQYGASRVGLLFPFRPFASPSLFSILLRPSPSPVRAKLTSAFVSS